MILLPFESPSNSPQLSFSGSNRVSYFNARRSYFNTNHFLPQEPGLREYFAIFSTTNLSITMMLPPLESP
jgi:hypothetical protein